MEQPRIVTRDEWLAARRDLLIKEKAMTRAKDALSAERRRLPMVKVDKAYVFDAPSGRKTLAELFDGRSQLIVYHFMMGPDWAEGCASCSFLADHIDAAVRAPRAPRRHAHRGLARAAREHRSLQETHGLALPLGVVFRE